MTVELEKVVTVSEFQTFIKRPENRERRFELMDGEIVEMPSNPFASVIAIRIAALLSIYLMQSQHEGYVTGEGGGFIINGQVFAPDVAYMRNLPTSKGFGEHPPLLAVEVISDPTSSAEQTDLRRKLVHYRAMGITVWVVDYLTQRVEVHQADGSMQIYDDTMTLVPGDILPDFTLPVKDIFPKTDENETE